MAVSKKCTCSKLLNRPGKHFCGGAFSPVTLIFLSMSQIPRLSSCFVHLIQNLPQWISVYCGVWWSSETFNNHNQNSNGNYIIDKRDFKLSHAQEYYQLSPAVQKYSCTKVGDARRVRGSNFGRETTFYRRPIILAGSRSDNAGS